MFIKLVSLAAGYDGRIDTLYGLDGFGQVYRYEVGVTVEGIDNLLVLTLSEGKRVASVGPIRPLSGHLSARDLAPNLE